MKIRIVSWIAGHTMPITKKGGMSYELQRKQEH